MKPIDDNAKVLADAVMYRIQQQRRSNLKWWLMLVVMLSASPFVANLFVGSDSSSESTKNTVRTLFTDSRASQSEPVVRKVPFTETTTITRNARRSYRIAALPGTYNITADAIGANFDPIIDLYRVNDSQELEFLSSDDDGNGQLNSRIATDLSSNETYELHVMELNGRPGSVTVSLRPAD